MQQSAVLHHPHALMPVGSTPVAHLVHGDKTGRVVLLPADAST
jgi:hypothetical protein